MAAKNPALIAIIVVALFAVGGVIVYTTTQNNNETPTTTQSTDATTQESDTADDAEPMAGDETTVTVYTDGEYTATGSYSTPGGSETVTVTVTLAGDTVTDVSTTGSATSGNSAQYQSAFLSGYKSEVVGKFIDDVSLSRVAGSSLTSTGFNKAIETIKNDARA